MVFRFDIGTGNQYMEQVTAYIPLRIMKNLRIM